MFSVHHVNTLSLTVYVTKRGKELGVKSIWQTYIQSSCIHTTDLESRPPTTPRLIASCHMQWVRVKHSKLHM